MKKSDLKFDLILGWNEVLNYLEQKGEVTKNEKHVFLDYFLLNHNEKCIAEKYKISVQELRGKLPQLLVLVLSTNKDLLEKGRHWEQIEEKVSKLKFNKLSKSIYSDEAWTKRVNTNFLIKRGWRDILTIYDLIFKMRLNPKRTKKSMEDNERLISITQEVIDKIGI